MDLLNFGKIRQRALYEWPLNVLVKYSPYTYFSKVFDAVYFLHATIIRSDTCLLCFTLKDLQFNECCRSTRGFRFWTSWTTILCNQQSRPFVLFLSSPTFFFLPSLCHSIRSVSSLRSRRPSIFISSSSVSSSHWLGGRCFWRNPPCLLHFRLKEKRVSLPSKKFFRSSPVSQRNKTWQQRFPTRFPWDTHMKYKGVKSKNKQRIQIGKSSRVLCSGDFCCLPYTGRKTRRK